MEMEKYKNLSRYTWDNTIRLLDRLDEYKTDIHPTNFRSNYSEKQRYFLLSQSDYQRRNFCLINY